LIRTAGSEYFSQNRRVTGILNLKIDGFADVIEKGFETGVAVFLVICFAPSVSRVRKVNISSGVMDSSSRSPNASEKRVKRKS
jgi:hypothetical protein